MFRKVNRGTFRFESAVSFIFFLLISLNISGQSIQMSFDHLTVDDGLSQSCVFSIAQDSKGFMWFGTRDGLNKYDSHTFKEYKHNQKDPNSLIGSVIFSLLSDKQGTLWVGTNNGLSIYNSQKDNFTNLVNNPKDPNSLSQNGIMYILEDRSHHIWVGTRNGLNLLISRNPYRFKRFLYYPHQENYVHSIFQDRAGIIWVGTERGLFELISAGKDQRYKIFCYRHNSNNVNSLSHDYINAISEDFSGSIWVGTEKGGINLLDKKTGKFTSALNSKAELFHLDETIRFLKLDPGGNMWMGTMSSGVFVLNRQGKKIAELRNSPDNSESLSDNSIRSIFIDRDRSFWIGTFFGGINFYSPKCRKFSSFKQVEKGFHLGHKVASAIVEDENNNFWIGTEGGGMIFWNRRSNEVQHYKHSAGSVNSISNNNIKTILPEGRKGLWIGTMNGLNYLNLANHQFTHYFSSAGLPNSIPHDRIYSIIKDFKGNLVLGTYGGGLAKLNTKSSKIEVFKNNPSDPASLSNNSITCLYEDSRHVLWIGTGSGLNRQLVNGKFLRFLSQDNNPSSISGNYINCIFEDKQKRLWIGTRGDGFSMFQPRTGKFVRYSVEQGLAGTNVNGILEDRKGFLWLSTNNGLSKFNPRNGEFKNYNKYDGLICKEFNINSYCKDRKGYMYFGGYNGIVVFHPDSILENTIIHPIVFTRLFLFNKEIKTGSVKGLLDYNLDETKKLTFHYNQNVFSIEFAVLNYILPHKNRYAYKLAGFEENWNYVANPVATYMNLKPGNYTLLVKGCNNDGVWNKIPIALKIHVLPPPWKTWWAYLVYLLIVAGAIRFFIRVKLARIGLEHNLYLEQLENKKQNELSQAKLRFFTNISHELRTPLTLILSPLESLLNSSIEPKAHKQLQLIQANANRILRLVNQLLDFRKQDTGNLKLKVAEGNIVKFIDEIVLAFQDYAHAKKINLEFHCQDDEIKVWYDRGELEKVVFNLISNALKFTPEGGNVSVSILTKHPDQNSPEGYIELRVEDNGIGISKENLSKIFTRFYQVEDESYPTYGFGIGLALTKGIVELHHGTIQVDSRDSKQGTGGFTRFTVSLLLGNSHFSSGEIVDDYVNSEHVESFISLESESNLVAFDEKDVSKSKNIRKYSVLIADDNAEIRNFLKEKLAVDYHIREAANGQEAWDIASRNLPDLIISDVLMPVMDGITLTKRLKSDERTNHIPVILVTARHTIIQQMEGLETGADDYITKPFSVSLLELKVKNLLSSREKLKGKYGKIISLEPQNTELSDPEEKFLRRLLKIIEEKMTNSDFNVTMLVNEIGMSRPVLFRKVKALTGLSVIELIRTTRLKKAALLLKQKKLSVAEVGYAIGFSDPKYFSKEFHKYFGKSPSEFLSQSEG